MSKLQVVVNSTINNRLPISYLKPLQGNLKTLSEESYQKLKASILKHGFSFPVFVWENPEDAQIYTIDGHQRIITLNKMNEEGYSIPQIPVVLIDAHSIQEAKSKLAVAASMYGDFNQDGVIEFFKDLDFELPEIKMPFINFDFPKNEEEPKTTTVQSHERTIENSSKEIDLNEFKEFDCKCPKCGFEYNV